MAAPSQSAPRVCSATGASRATPSTTGASSPSRSCRPTPATRRPRPGARAVSLSPPTTQGDHAASRGGGQSGRLDSHQRPLGPQPSALPDCATPRWRPILAPDGRLHQARDGGPCASPDSSFSSAAGSSGSEWTECCGSGGGAGSGSAGEGSLSISPQYPRTRENAPGAGIEETTRGGYPAVRLADGDLAATFVPRLGMIGASLEHGGEELLGQRNGLAAYEAKGSTMGIPLLYPWANRLAGPEYGAAGRQVTIALDSPLVRLDPNGLPIHGGLAANPHWEATGELEARLDFGARPELLEAFPFPHELRLAVELEAGALTITTTVDANQGSPVPVSFGFHPYLALPHVRREDWHIAIPATEHLTLDDKGIPTDETTDAGPLDGPLGDRTFDDAYAGITGDF